jgi:hypothetical protein
VAGVCIRTGDARGRGENAILEAQTARWKLHGFFVFSRHEMPWCSLGHIGMFIEKHIPSHDWRDLGLLGTLRFTQVCLLKSISPRTATPSHIGVILA